MPTIRKNLQTNVCHVDFELDEKEYWAIGRVTAQWAYLEHGIYAVTKAISIGLNIDVPKDALSTSFKRRLTALRLLVEEFAPDEERKRMLSLIGKIANAEQDRHKITHAMWEWDRFDPERINASSFRPGFEFEKQFDAVKMHELAIRIGEISFALEYPDGWNGALEAMLEASKGPDGNVAYGHISRQLRRELSSRKAQAPQRSAQAKPPKSRRPRPSSGE